MYNTPILFLIFARPDTTQKVFDRIRAIKPTRLYVAADAAREGRQNEKKRCEETRAIIDTIDWDCEVKRLYRDRNLGCKNAVSEAITWFFEQEEYGVILEDDCLPDLSFFPYCEELLLRYKEDDRIGHISGNCFFAEAVDKNYSYDFCSFSHSWGWASWRRVWKNYDLNFTYWEKFKHNKTKIDSLFNTYKEKIYYSSFISDAIKSRNGISAWDTQYAFMLRVQSQLCICPTVNLVTNIGLFSPDATHTISKNTRKSYFLSYPIALPIKHPEYILRNKALDKKTPFSWKRLLRYIFNHY